MNTIKKVFLTALIIIGLTFSIDTMAQDSPPPAPPSEHGSSGNQGGRAPIGGGLLILLGLGAAYGGKKIYDLKKNKLEE